ncbi:WLM domain-containing protein [Obelidium mucronatum]|nr:WLM domain-containing protein [Obelidium mucronatum]
MPPLLRLNERSQRPNKFIDFISVLPTFKDSDFALKIMNQIAAVVRPLMQRHGLAVRSFEEFVFNKEFAGRNWNSGEARQVIELVLRNQAGSFLPFPFLIHVMLHELTHIKNMSHNPQFFKSLAALSDEYKSLRATGYTGDGFWSKGVNLNGTEYHAVGFGGEAVPFQSLCGGSWKKTRKSQPGSTIFRKKRKRKFEGVGEKVGVSEEGPPTGKAKPRVAQSKAGRDRALQAALSRIAKPSTDSAKAGSSWTAANVSGAKLEEDADIFTLDEWERIEDFSDYEETRQDLEYDSRETKESLKMELELYGFGETGNSAKVAVSSGCSSKQHKPALSNKDTVVCPICTFSENSSTAPVCLVCESVIVAQNEDESAETSSIWKCLACGIRNHSSWELCHGCGRQLQ